MSSQFFTILTAVVDAIEGLSLTFNSTLVPVSIKKLPKSEENIDTLPMILVTPSTSNFAWRRASFQLQEFVTYTVEVSIIGSGNLNLSSNMDVFNSWYESIRTLFKTGIPLSATKVWQTKVKPGADFDRGFVKDMYDFLLLTLELTTIE